MWLSNSICSSNSEWSTMAAAPASSIRRMVSRLRDSGDAEGTSGLASCSPRYVVERSGVIGFILPDQLRVAQPAIVHILLSQRQQSLCFDRVALGEHAVARLGVDVVLERDAGRFRVEVERLAAVVRQTWVVVEQRPVPGEHRLFLLFE